MQYSSFILSSYQYATPFSVINIPTSFSFTLIEFAGLSTKAAFRIIILTKSNVNNNKK